MLGHVDAMDGLPCGIEEAMRELDDCRVGADLLQRALDDAHGDVAPHVPEVGDHIVIRGGHRHLFRDCGRLKPAALAAKYGLVHAGGRVTALRGGRPQRAEVVVRDFSGSEQRTEVPCLPHSLMPGEDGALLRRQQAALRGLLRRRDAAAARARDLLCTPGDPHSDVAVMTLLDASLAPELLQRVTVHQSRRTGRVLLGEAAVLCGGDVRRMCIAEYDEKYCQQAASAAGDGVDCERTTPAAGEWRPAELEVQALHAKGGLSDEEAALLLLLPDYAPGSWQQMWADLSREQRYFPWESPDAAPAAPQ
eukprot:TRINITY_DN46926_c0_g1_i1.p1 TRINITY_DN46926_c0_g1~~TRINITY_DN46926_c0_g1_i1.p1  ORF type:complete len:334 (+),score=102.76 TRINITY_DN46926_c0_g1_i1:82-1002(+)